MNKFISVFLMLAIVVVGSFSLLILVSHTHEDGHLCPVSTINGGYGSCESAGPVHGDVTSAMYHLNGIQEFSNVIANEMSFVYFLLIIFMYILSAILLLDSTLLFFKNFILNKLYSMWNIFIYNSVQSFVKWLVCINNDTRSCY